MFLPLRNNGAEKWHLLERAKQKREEKKRQETPMKRQAGRDEREQRGGVEAKREQTLEREEGASQFESKKSRGE